MICGNCGTEINSGNFCPECGEKLTTINKVENVSNQKINNDISLKVNDIISDGHKYFRKKQYLKSLECFNEALKIDSNSKEAYVLKGEILFLQKDYESALCVYKDYLKINPNDAEILTNIGASLVSLGRSTESIKYFDKALQIDSDLPLTYYNKGIALKKISGNDSEGDECLKKFIEIAPTNLKPHKKFANQLLNGKKTVSNTTQNPMINITFYESMPGRASLNNNKSYINGVLEIADTEIIIHKKSFWRGKDRGTKHIRYDKITSIDFDRAKLLSPASIQLYLSSVEYSFRSNDTLLESFYEKIRLKIDESQMSDKNSGSNTSSLDELKKLNELKEMGVVTEEEFELKKKQLLGL